ncbi:PepSY domain-containing protein [Aquamicrobium soli]|jgi:hypothetical protein|uniref:PepSY domain-containing protein n=1 Tax=Aquamicrobium soli TaxID=1811518 RepID=A0ABV7KET7_9HYPH
MLKPISAATVLLMLLSGTSLAQEADKAPPQNAKKLSEIIAKVEQRQDFRYIGEIDWDEGVYDVTYYTTDRAKVEIKYDPVSGNPK